LGNRKRIITVSNANKQAISKNWRISETRQKFVYVIYNCADEPPTQSRPSADDHTTKDIVTMGHLVSYKNPDGWLKTATTLTRQFANVRFIWLGSGDRLNELKIKTEGNKNILFPGFINDPIPYLQKATIYYQPSLQETHGIAVLEAMSCHLPCVVSEAGGLPESVADGVNGLVVPPDDVNKHVAALKKLITDPRLCNDYGWNGYKKYQQQFSFKPFKSAMDRVYLH
jgi:glycosyltransferase involved in cell wall biosynthesis